LIRHVGTSFGLGVLVFLNRLKAKGQSNKKKGWWWWLGSAKKKEKMTKGCKR
jgi:hypothetical protein